jgi:predicted adenine nucleotide alpha hydrolase (AANH) superfamily ATPase
MSPYSRYSKQNRKYMVDSEKSTRCTECIRIKISCNVQSDGWNKNVPSLGDWESIARQKEILEEQEEEAMAKILRLRK